MGGGGVYPKGRGAHILYGASNLRHDDGRNKVRSCVFNLGEGEIRLYRNLALTRDEQRIEVADRLHP